MDWHYTVEGQRKGPVTEEEFQWLVKDGIVTPQTLVWCFGMDDWRPYRDVPPVAVEPPRPASPKLVDGLTCAGCRESFPPGEMIPLAGGHYCITCKPLAIQRLKEGVISNHNAEAMRHQYLKHEKSVRTVAFLYFLGGGGGIVAGIGRIFMATKFAHGVGTANGAIIIVLGICYLWVAIGLRRFKAWARTPTIVLSCVGLLGFPVVTLFSIYILTVMLQQKTKLILSDEYRMTIEQTLHLKCRISIIVWIVVFLMAFLAVAALFVFYDRRVRHGH